MRATVDSQPGGWLDQAASRISGGDVGVHAAADVQSGQDAASAGEKKVGEQLAGNSDLNRMELSPADDALQERYSKITYSAQAIDELLATVFQELKVWAPRRIVLDLDATDLPPHGQQEKRLLHGYYNHYRSLPLYIFSGDHLPRARPRPANIDGSAGSLEEVKAVMARLRVKCEKTQMILRADSGFCRDELMSWCEANGVDYVFGFARNDRLRELIEPRMQEARAEHARTGQAARVFTEFEYETRDSWSRSRWVAAKAEQIKGNENPRYVVTSLGAESWPAQSSYEKLYCERGEMENRIKEQMEMFADRLSTETMWTSQLRLYLASLAYVLVRGLGRLALKGSEWAEAQVETNRLRLLNKQARGTNGSLSARPS